MRRTHRRPTSHSLLAAAAAKEGGSRLKGVGSGLETGLHYCNLVAVGQAAAPRSSRTHGRARWLAHQSQGSSLSTCEEKPHFAQHIPFPRPHSRSAVDHPLQHVDHSEVAAAASHMATEYFGRRVCGHGRAVLHVGLCTVFLLLYFVRCWFVCRKSFAWRCSSRFLLGTPLTSSKRARNWATETAASAQSGPACAQSCRLRACETFTVAFLPR